jgi:Carboxymuconolactone decarboxylase family
MARAPAVLASYTGIRKALDELGTFDAKTRTAVMLTVGNVDGGDYFLATISRLAKRAGWSDGQLAEAFAHMRGRVRMVTMSALVVALVAGPGFEPG